MQHCWIIRTGVYSVRWEGFVSVPKGCYIQLEKIAAEYVLENIKAHSEQEQALLVVSGHLKTADSL